MDYHKLYTTKELEKYITHMYNRIELLTRRDRVYTPLKTAFTKCMPNSPEGDYCFADADGYHFCTVERGVIQGDSVTKSLFDISFNVIESQVFWVAVEYERKHRINNQDSRRMIFSKELQYLDEIGEDYRKRAEVEINETLRQNPFQDELFK
jgi:hypothetical protein